MIFVTIGSMFPFNRLVEAMDNWAAAHPGENIFCQIGNGTYEPRHMPFARMLAPTEFNRKVEQASLVVAHAGMGSVITAAENGKPLVMLPRLLEHGEHNTDHQLHTARWLSSRENIYVADTVVDLGPTIKKAQASAPRNGNNMARIAPADFTDRLRQALLQ